MRIHTTRTTRSLVATAALTTLALLPFAVSAQQTPESAVMTASEVVNFLSLGP